MLSFFNAVNCYCDASLTKLADGTVVTGSGYILTYEGNVIDKKVKIVADSTNNYGEILAIYMGVDALIRVAGYDAFLNLFSDSKISVSGLTAWIYSWIRDTDPSTRMMHNSSGQLVANQEIFSAIVGLICNARTHLSIFHQRGHMNPDNVRDMRIMMEDFEKDNGTVVGEDIIREITYWNDCIDNLTRDTLLRATTSPGFNKEQYKKPMVVVSNVLNIGMMQDYRKLIG